MEIKISKEEQNPLFNRKEVQGIIKAESIPSKIDVAKELAKKFSVPYNAVRVLDVQGKFGTKEFPVRANIYPSQEKRDELENLTQKEKDAETKAEAPKEEPKEETPSEPVEEKKEEAKVPAEETIGLNPVEEAKKLDEKRAKEDKKEKDKSKEEKLNEKELQA